MVNPYQKVNIICDLRVLINSSLTFIPHINNITNNDMKIFGFINRNTESFHNRNALKTLYCSLVRIQSLSGLLTDMRV